MSARMSGRRIAAVFFVFSFLADRVTKYAASCLGWEISGNSGISFGLLRGAPSASVCVAAAAAVLFLVFLIFAYADKEPPIFAAGLGAAAGGALGNAADRVFYGHVVDWLPVPCPFFTVLWMNLADFLLIAGGGAVFFCLVWDGFSRWILRRWAR